MRRNRTVEIILAVLVLLLLFSCSTMATTLNGRRIEVAKSGKTGEFLYELQKNRALKYFKGNDKVLDYCDDAHLVLSGTHYLMTSPSVEASRMELWWSRPL